MMRVVRGAVITTRALVLYRCMAAMQMFYYHTHASAPVRRCGLRRTTWPVASDRHTVTAFWSVHRRSAGHFTSRWPFS